MIKRVFIAIAATFVLAAASPVSAESQDVDTRTNLGLSDGEKAFLMSEMRQMLGSIQGIITGIGSEDREMIIKSAKPSGNNMARATPASIKKKFPPAFRELGGPTHMMFEELVVIAETDNMDMLASFTGELMQQCIACHAAFRAN